MKGIIRCGESKALPLRILQCKGRGTEAGQLWNLGLIDGERLSLITDFPSATLGEVDVNQGAHFPRFHICWDSLKGRIDFAAVDRYGTLCPAFVAHCSDVWAGFHLDDLMNNRTRLIAKLRISQHVSAKAACTDFNTARSKLQVGSFRG